VSFMDVGANTYLIRPNYKDKFKAGAAKECIREILREQLYGQAVVFSDVGFDRYKLIVQVVVGEQRGEGVKMAARCFWDADTDSYAQDIFMNVSEELFLH
uniref:Tctex1 domain-containing protein 2-like n=1 Tax=Sinocyclocheilus rhinocerous TaxID=307959 RepID=A0A673LRZ7_9TELE